MKLYILLQIKHVQTSFCLQSSFCLMVLKYLSSSGGRDARSRDARFLQGHGLSIDNRRGQCSSLLTPPITGSDEH
jgi:hypothetical protein